MHTLLWQQTAKPRKFRCDACQRRWVADAFWTIDGHAICDDCLDTRYGEWLKCRTPGCHRYGEAAELFDGRCEICRQRPDPDADACAVEPAVGADNDNNDAVEIGSEANAQCVQQVCQEVSLALAAGRPVRDWQRVVHDIDRLVRECNSGASLEQYFRWATPEQIARIVPALQAVGLDEVATIVSGAMTIAFPRALPRTAAAQGRATRWTAAQQRRLAALFPAFEHCNGQIINALGRWVRRHEPR